MSRITLRYSNGRKTTWNDLPDTADECRSMALSVWNRSGRQKDQIPMHDRDLRDALLNQAIKLDQRSIGTPELRSRSAATPPARRIPPPPDETRTYLSVPHDKPVDPLAGTPSEVRSKALSVVEKYQSWWTPEQLDHLDAELRSESPAATWLARRAIVTGRPSYMSAFMTGISRSQPSFTAMEKYALEQYWQLDEMQYRGERRSASEGTGNLGGYGVPIQIDPTVVPAGGELASIADAATIVEAIGPTWKGVVSDPSVAFEWHGEASVVADSTPTLVQPVIDVFTADQWIPWSFEVGQDFPNFQENFTAAINNGYQDLLAQATAIGSGSGQPFGLFTAMQNTTTSPSHVTVTTAGSISATDVRAAWSAVPPRFRKNATWVCHEDVLTRLRNIDGAASQVDLVVDRAGTTIMGRPVLTSSYCPDWTGTSGAASYLVVGDLSGYTIAKRTGLVVELISHVRDHTTARPTMQRGWLATARFGATVTVPQALRLLSNS